MPSVMPPELVRRSVLALAWCLALLVSPLVMVGAEPLQAAQVRFLQDCQTAWGKTIPGWSGASPDCGTAKGLMCNGGGLITVMQLPNIQLSGSIPASISALRELTFLDFSWNQLTGGMPSSVVTLTNLVTLLLKKNQLSGGIPSNIGILTRLRTFDLSYNKFSGSIPASISALNQLDFLGIDSNQFTGGVPTGIGSLTNLKTLFLHRNPLAGSIPSQLGSLAGLRILDLRESQLSGSIPATFSALSRLTFLSMYGNQLTGGLPAGMESMTSLVTLLLSGNQLTGPLPSNFSSLSRLSVIDLSDNSFSGSIPASISFLQQMTYMSLFSNKLTGGMPMGLASMTNLVTLFLHRNQLAGSIPSNIGGLTKLQILDLRYNKLSGSIPDSISALKQLTFLSLYSNQLTGAMPTGIVSLTNLGTLFLHRNQLTGSILSNTGALTSLHTLDLSYNQLMGSIPTSISTLTRLTFLSLYFNQLSGEVPTGIASLTNLVTLFLHRNQLAGSIPSNIGALTKLQTLDLSVNSLSGSIPPSITALRQLTFLNIFSNQLTAAIPSNIGSLANLVTLDLSLNQLSESIPASISALSQLTRLSLFINRLTGCIPPALTSLPKLIDLRLFNNYLTSSVPGNIGSLTKLAMLDLSSNQLSGPIPDSMSSLTQLTFLALDQNELQGSIPGGIFSLGALNRLRLGVNQLTGSIPNAISRLTNLTRLELQRNQLTGTIPGVIGGLSTLGYLILAFNQLYGSIPATVTKLTNLIQFDLSHNYLTGPIVKPAAATNLDLSSNFLSGPLLAAHCVAASYDANCFALPPGCTAVAQRDEAACNAFCGLSTRAAASATCGGRGLCYPEGSSLVPTCLCDSGFELLDFITCMAEGQSQNFSTIQRILPPATTLTNGTKQETAGWFTKAPVALFAAGTGQGCGLELAFNASFSFSLSPNRSSGGNGFAFVVTATASVGGGAGVGYQGMDNRSMAVEFDTVENVVYGDMRPNGRGVQHVGLNIGGSETSIAAVASPFQLNAGVGYWAWVQYLPADPGTIQVFLADRPKKPEQALLERRVSLCAVLRGSPKEQQQQGVAPLDAFFFGFVASTTVAPFQRHVILSSTVATGLPSHSPVSIRPAYGLALTAETYMPQRSSPFTRYVSADYNSSANQQDTWRFRNFHSWDSMPFLGWPVKNQEACNACWAFAVVASVEAAYGIATNKEAPQLSVESLFAAMGSTSYEEQCRSGGSPTKAFETLVALPKGGLALNSMATWQNGASLQNYPVHGFERTQFMGYLGLMHAVQRQPVVVHIEASAATFVEYDGSFKYQDPDCYTGNLNHVVLVIGYYIKRDDGSQSRIAPPFWIVRNSWGVEWGDRGQMRMDIQGGDGVCGINVLPGMYPIVKISGDPCGLKSFRLDLDPQPTMNPCGRFECVPNTKANSNTCDCTLAKEIRQPFVEVQNGYLSNTCAYVDVCGSFLSNPCYVGTCINNGNGSYSCICPPDHISSTTIDNLPTCDPAFETATSMVVNGDNWQCSDVYPAVGLTATRFTQQNTAIDCNKPLQRNTVVQVGGTPATPCSAFLYVLKGDTCVSIYRQLGLNQSQLLDLNPGLDCTKNVRPGQSVCMERNATFAYTVPQCVRHVMLTKQDTCERLIQRMLAGEASSPEATARLWAQLYRINPGLVRSGTIPNDVASAGSKAGVEVCLRAEYWLFNEGHCVIGIRQIVDNTLSCSAAFTTYYSRNLTTGKNMFVKYNNRNCSRTVNASKICVPKTGLAPKRVLVVQLW